MKRHPWFTEEPVACVSIHDKATVLAPILRAGLGVHVVPLATIDTDAYGTFTGEIPRRDSQLMTAQAKARAGIAHGFAYSLASEGSFAPHPQVPLLTVNREVVVLIMRDKDVVLTGWAASLETQAQRQVVTSIDAAGAFLDAVGYPDQGVIVETQRHDGVSYAKELTQRAALLAHITPVLREGRNVVTLATDLRAHRNPMRRRVIAAAGHELVANAQRFCPDCGTPGVHVVRPIIGLPCEVCGVATDQVFAYEYGCVRCEYRAVVRDMSAPVVASAGQCAWCNP